MGQPTGHPNKGYLLLPPFYSQHSYLNENFPGSVQTQVTGLNNRGVTVGFWSDMNNANMSNDNFGFVDVDGQFRTADFPTGSPASPPVDQLLGVNSFDEVVGVFTPSDNANAPRGSPGPRSTASPSSTIRTASTTATSPPPSTA